MRLGRASLTSVQNQETDQAAQKSGIKILYLCAECV